MEAAPTFSWLDWDDAGVVEKLGPEAIVTSFQWIVVPVRAGKSFYRFRTRDGAEDRFEIPRHGRSVLLGHLRTPLWLAATFLASPSLIASMRWELLPIALVLGAVAAYLTFAVGRLSRDERDRRALLRRAFGIGAPPELLPTTMREALREALADRWFHEHQVGWREAIVRGMASEILVALAEYQRNPRMVIRARTNLINAEGN